MLTTVFLRARTTSGGHGFEEDEDEEEEAELPTTASTSATAGVDVEEGEGIAAAAAAVVPFDAVAVAAAGAGAGALEGAAIVDVAVAKIISKRAAVAVEASEERRWQPAIFFLFWFLARRRLRIAPTFPSQLS